MGPQALAAAGLPSARSRTLRRRRDVFVALLVAAAVTLLLALVVPAMLVVNLVADALLVAYVALLVRQRNRVAERDMKVRFLPGPRPIEPALLRRSVN